MKYDKNDIKVIKFAEFYVETGNALDSARRAGFDNPMAAAKELRKKDSPAQELIKEYYASVQSPKIMSSVEVLERLTSIARGETIAYTPMVVGKGDGVSEVEHVEVTPSIREQSDALKTLGKIYGLDKGYDATNQLGGVSIQIVGADMLED